MRSHALFVLLSLPLLDLSSSAQDVDEDDPVVKLGHSAHGESFDEGPRQKPWKLENIGSSHFPITTSVPEVQEWFDQGNTLLHSFWYYEAERAFRWCLKLDPDCAMAWWGLARSTGRGMNERAREFLEEAVKRKDTVTDRERMYIEAWESSFAPHLSGAIETLDEEGRRGSAKLAEELEMICIAYPDDVEAKALHMLYSLYDSSRVGNELIAQAIFRDEPFHPGAHHYRIHNWDGPEGAQALSSCEIYGELASYIGHANHMPGHIYSGIGMWHEGAIWMDRATRVEKRYMQEQLVFPFNHWNYAHNRNYLSYIQEQLGLFAAAQDGARQLLAAPLDPKYNQRDGGWNVHGQGMTALRRGLVKFERWDEILEEGSVPWRDIKEDKVWRAYMEALAHLYLGHEREAIDSMIALKELQKDDEERGGARFIERMLLEVRGVHALSQGNIVEGTNLLETAAAEQLESFHGENDPPSYPRVLSNVLGEAYLGRGAPELAAACFERTLETVINDGFALAGLVDAYAKLGQRERATEAWGRLLFVWSDADSGLRVMERAASYGFDSKPIDLSPKEQRNYASQVLTAMGPETWEPYPAPELEALDPDNEEVTLDAYFGQNVVVVFYIGEECVHCVDQLIAIDERMDDFAERNTVVLAVSGDSPEKNKASLKMGELGFRLLSDPGFENARRWKSYDDFEELELHSTNFVDTEGHVRWARTGGEPFMDLDFLLAEIDRVNEDLMVAKAVEAAVETGAADTTEGGSR